MTLKHLVCAGALALTTAGPLQAQTPPAATPPSPQATEATDEARRMPSFLSLFTDLPGDARHLFTAGNGISLGVGGGAALAVHPKDDEVAARAPGWTSLDSALRAGSALGDGGAQAGFALGIYIIGRGAHHPRTAQIGADLVRAQIINAVMTDGLKPIVDRQRPNGGNYSFPSGHTSSAFATASVLHRRLGWKVGVPAYGVASYVATSRLTDHKHYPSDLIVGATLGIISGRATTFRSHDSTVHITPHASARSAGVLIAWVPDGQ